jgi:hypothetical protein
VLFIGCSLGAGDGVSNQDRFSEILEQILPGIESHNYSLSGSGNDQQLLVHREFASIVKPDVLVICSSAGSIGRTLLTKRLHRDALTGGSILVPKPYFTLAADGALVQHQVPVPKPSLQTQDDPRFRAQRLSTMGRIKRAVAAAIGRQAPQPASDVYDNPSDPAYRLGHALLTCLLSESRAPVKLVAPLPDIAIAARSDATNHHRFFQTLAETTGARFVDLAVYFRRLSPDRRGACFFRHDGHYTRTGHEIIARALADQLRELRAPES